MKPLEGVRIVEMTHVISAPYCGQLLGDMGADIIKLEKQDGEFSRSVSPKTPDGKSLWFANYNRNKKSVTMNFRSPRAIELIRELVSEADVFIENMRPGLVNALGLGYEELKKINPRLIMCSISGYGQTGPARNLAAFDMNIEAMNGIMSLTGEPDGRPMKVGTAITDFTASFCGAIGILAALRARDKTGEGQYVDVSMLEASLPLTEIALAEYVVLGQMPPRVGNRRASSAPCNVFETKTGFVYMSCMSSNLYERLMKLMGREDLITTYPDGPSRKKNEEAIEAVTQQWVSQYTTDELIEIMDKASLPISRVNTVKEILADDHIKFRDTIRIEQDPDLGDFPFINFPIKFSSLETVFEKPPTLGQHTEEVLTDLLGYTKEQVAQFAADDVI